MISACETTPKRRSIVIEEKLEDHQVIVGDCRDVLISMKTDSVDCVITSPPYAAQRDLGIGWDLKGEAWVTYMLGVFLECLRVSRGMVCFVVEGAGMQTMDYSSEPILLHADLFRRGIKMCKPSIYGRYSLPGRFTVLRNNWEPIICATANPETTYSKPTATGGAPKCAPGGKTRPRTKDGSRSVSKTEYKQPKAVNAGNIIWCGAVGGGQMGDPLAHNNEAPYPEFLASVLVQTYCPPGGTVMDCFAGSGTTAAMARRHGRKSINVEIRPQQADNLLARVFQAKYDAVIPDNVEYKE